MSADAAASAALARSRALLLAGRPEQALTELASLPVDEAVGPFAAYLRCAALGQLGRWSELVEAAREALSAHGPDPNVLGLLGQAEQELGHMEAAERALLEGLALAPDDVDLLCGYADLCASNNQGAKAQKLVERAAAQQPNAAVVYATRVKVAYLRGDDRAAQRISREFVAAYPENPVAQALLGGASAVRGQVAAGYAGLRQAVAAAPAEQAYAESALELRIATHPLLLPIRPIIRFGPLTSWIAAIAIIFGFRLIGLPLFSAVAALVWLALCVYSWVVPPLVTRWIRRRWR